ncbi:ABC-F family ATP-binding cassette domain-containing protein [Lentzea sp. PSKA42]|uniref:ABC-F family ATP-binding cassette domain-containing protein n=2 Tax=Lentzea indica TaxID=2604800 RepID=A0ABX1FEJ6_9PSEU|nr:ATP-binding cassette domain-containing protein [Lentzea indica]NKE57287.1 ABC-F family ATP-binding cassette domain-containing protein [Lentzea indica]
MLDDVSLTVRPGEKVGVVGENGSGKSTLLRLMAKQDVPDDGEIIVFAQGVGYLAQVLDLPGDATVGDAIDERTITRYGDGYAGYVAEKKAARQRWEQAYAEWVGEIGHWTEWRGTTAYRVAPGRPIPDHNKCKYNGDGRRVQESIRTRVRSASERLERLRADPVPKPPEPLHLNAPLDARVREGAVLELREARVDQRMHVGELTVEAGQRLLVTGPNGTGKSTLLDVLAGALEPDHGTVTRNGVVGYLPQETVVHNAKQTVLAAFGADAERLRALGLFRETDFATPVGALSIGQRRRLALARLLHQESDVLLLDEPTNHLSLALVEELEAALADYPGAVVVASHDRLLRQRWQGEELRMARSSRTSR